MNEARSFSPLRLCIMLVAAGSAIAAFLFFLNPTPDDNSPDEEPVTPPAVQTPDFKRMLSLANSALGELENKHYAAADEHYREILTALPDEILPYRNLAITRVLTLLDNVIDKKKDPAGYRDALQLAQQAIDELLAQAPDSGISHLLAGKLAEHAGDMAKAVSEFRAATKAEPESAPFWYELFVAAQHSDDESVRDESYQAIHKAHDLAPDNLFALVDLLLAQLSAKDSKLAETLESSRDTIQPFVTRIQQLRRFDIAAAIDRAKQAIADDKWPAAIGAVRPTCNLLRPEIASQIDGRRISRNLLEYVVREYSPDFYDRAREAGATMDSADSGQPGIVVQFNAPEESDQFPTLDAVDDAAVADFDLDGRVDLIVARKNRVEVYSRHSDSASWSQIVQSDELDGVTRVVLADLDRDYNRSGSVQSGQPDADGKSTAPGKAMSDTDLDVIAYGPGGIVVLQNVLAEGETQRSLKVMPQTGELASLTNVAAVAVADLEHDGDLDLVAAADGVSLWLNREDFTFFDGGEFSQTPPNGTVISTITPVDWNRNIATDLILAGPESAPGLLENVLHGRFRWRETDGVPADAKPAAHCSIADVDGNGAWDIVAAGGSGLCVYRTLPARSGITQSYQTVDLAESPQSGSRILDFDNDGTIDILSWSTSAVTLQRGTGGGVFKDVSEIITAALGSDGSTAALNNCLVADIDADGDEDVILVRASGVTWLSNEGGNENSWCDIVLQPESNPEQFPSQRVNIHAYGSTVEVLAGSHYQQRIVTSPVTHVGLGNRGVDTIRVTWTDGVPQNVVNPQCGDPIVAKQDLKGSCPYLYTWNGREFEFVTDLCWGSPLGLQMSNGQLAPSREWEYLKIPGRFVKPVDGRYRLRVTEELWEAAYFDQIRFIAVDHPEEDDIYTNEKMGPAAIAEHRIHTVTNPRTPQAVADAGGVDLLSLVQQRDDRFARAWTHRDKQGLVEPHFLEIDLGELDDPEQITLFLTGWIKPTDTSINLAISQNESLVGPIPPSIQVPNDDGEWTETVPFMGFPGGKTKTIAIDLSNVFLTNDYRLRIHASQELYWDHVFFTVDEPPGDVRTTDLPLAGATLRYRGFSPAIRRPHNAPVIYDYEHGTAIPRWTPMRGRFTRYGPVDELIRQRDDRMVVMSPGDEIELEFEALNDPPVGWVRDFVIHNVGWDKDADLNTIYGQSSEPFPFSGMTGYPFEADETERDDPEWKDYLETWQTRRQEWVTNRNELLRAPF